MTPRGASDSFTRAPEICTATPATHWLAAQFQPPQQAYLLRWLESTPAQDKVFK